MEKKLLVSVVVLIVVALATSSVMALAPMGPASATLKQGERRIGFEYAHSEMDLDISASGALEDYLDDNGYDSDVKVKDVESNTFAGNLGYGLANEWEIFARLGAYNTEWEESTVNFDGDYGFFGGIGTKITWAKQENIDWGLLVQGNLLNPKGDITDEDVDGSLEYEIDAYEVQIAVGPTFKVSDSLSFYGGPFLHFYDGEIEVENLTADLEQDSMFGGYVGMQLDVKPKEGEITNGFVVFAELQSTGDAWAIATGLGWKF